ncbi:MAG TPA: hypothetical protein VGL20_06640 [Candidatus Dormibacteraeota bacterium]
MTPAHRAPGSPAEVRDGALARLASWRIGIAAAAVAAVAGIGAVAAATIPGHSQASNGAAQVTDPGAAQPQDPQPPGAGGFQPPPQGPGAGFGRGQAVTGGS